MSFSARQLHCMHAMGLVAWTRTPEPASAAVADGVETALHKSERDDHNANGSVALPGNIASASEPANASVAAKDSSTTSSSEAAAIAAGMPIDIDSVAAWLVEQSLVEFNYRGTSVSCSGPEQASLLVVCVHPDIPAQEAASVQPLNAECTQLLKLMLRSIDLSMTDIRQCLINAGQSGSPVSAHESAPVAIDGICTPHTLGVLLLDPQCCEDITHPRADNCLLPTNSLPLWRIPHPDCLLQNPALKRRAWESLKVLKQALDSHRLRA